MEMKHRIQDLSNVQLENEIHLLEIVINTFPQIDPPNMIIFVDELSKNIVGKKTRVIIESFNRFNALGLVKNPNYTYMYSKNIVKFTVNENKVRNYLVDIKNESESRKANIGNMNSNKLLINTKTGLVKFTLLNGKTRSDELKKRTSEYGILYYLAQNQKVAFEAIDLVGSLRKARAGAEESDPEQRVRYVIDALRGKFGDEVINSVNNGYLVDSSVEFI